MESECVPSVKVPVRPGPLNANVPEPLPPLSRMTKVVVGLPAPLTVRCADRFESVPGASILICELASTLRTEAFVVQLFPRMNRAAVLAVSE